jgi:ketosteroid isomerase-like protein
MTNIDRLRKAYQAWHDSRGTDTAAWLDLLGDDVALQSLGGGHADMAFTAPKRGKDQARDYLAGLARDWEMQFFHADEYIGHGDRVVMVGRCAWKHRHTGKVAESPIAHVWRFADGKATDFYEFFDTARAFAAARGD